MPTQYPFDVRYDEYKKLTTLLKTCEPTARINLLHQFIDEEEALLRSMENPILRSHVLDAAKRKLRELNNPIIISLSIVIPRMPVFRAEDLDDMQQLKRPKFG